MGGASTRLEEREDSAGDSEENVEEESANVWVSDELAQDLREAAAVAGRGPQEVAGSAQGTEELEARRALSAEDDRKLAAVQAAERQESAQVNAWVTKVQSRTKLHHVPRGVESCGENTLHFAFTLALHLS
jgi:hypothetical protein